MDKKIKELCETNNIDEEIVEKFISETGAYPFLMGKPSSYLLMFSENIEGIKITTEMPEIFVFSQNTTNLTSIYSLKQPNESKCDHCKNLSLWDFVILEENSEPKQICFYCFSKKTLAHYLELPEDDIENYWYALSEIKNYTPIIKMILITLHCYSLSIFKTKPEVFQEIKHYIQNNTITGIIFKNFQYINPYYVRIKLYNTIRSVYPNKVYPRRFNFDFDHLKFYKDRNYAHDHMSNLRNLIKTASTYYGSRIAPWMTESKTGSAVYGYVQEMIKETDKAILCKFSLLNHKSLTQSWIPKSTIEKESQYFSQLIERATLKKMGMKV